MATAAKYPLALLTLADVGGEASGFPEAVLSGAHNNSVTTITLTATVPSYWPTSGWVTIDSEIISYGGKSGVTLTSCVRGAQSAYSGSVAASHNDLSKVAPYLTPQAVSQIMADQVAMQAQSGIGNFAGESVARILWDWDGKAAIESTLVGTGTYAIAPALNTYTAFGTGGTSGGSSAGRIQIGAGGSSQNGVGKLRLLKLHYQYGQIDANINSKIYVTDESVTGNPSDTARHIGLRQAGTVINFSTGDGATEQVTDVSSFMTAAADVFVDITYDGVTARCYINATLRATHATNVPAAVGSVPPIFRVYVVNSAAAVKTVYFHKAHAVLTF